VTVVDEAYTLAPVRDSGRRLRGEASTPWSKLMEDKRDDGSGHSRLVHRRWPNLLVAQPGFSVVAVSPGRSGRGLHLRQLVDLSSASRQHAGLRVPPEDAD